MSGRRNDRALIVALSLAVCTLLSCSTTRVNDPRSFSAAPLYGMIYDLDNRPVAKALLTIDGKRGPNSDVTGRFVVPSLARGSHEIVAEKEGYETLRISLSFLDDTQVLYLQICSQQQLLSLAGDKIEEMEWGEAHAYLRRAAAVDETDPVYRFITAILDLHLNQPREAEKTLLSLLATGYEKPAIYLFLADLHQFLLEKPEEAANDLRRYLALRSDPQVQKRLKALEGAATK